MRVLLEASGCFPNIRELEKKKKGENRPNNNNKEKEGKKINQNSVSALPMKCNAPEWS